MIFNCVQGVGWPTSLTKVHFFLLEKSLGIGQACVQALKISPEGQGATCHHQGEPQSPTNWMRTQEERLRLWVAPWAGGLSSVLAMFTLGLCHHPPTPTLGGWGLCNNSASCSPFLGSACGCGHYLPEHPDPPDIQYHSPGKWLLVQISRPTPRKWPPLHNS